jgi:Trk K+ transport system NAD-binding subunit
MIQNSKIIHPKRISIIGAGTIGSAVLKNLVDHANIVKIIDQNQSTLHHIPESVLNNNNVTTYCGDGTKEEVLRKSGLQDTEICFALTGSDSVNLFIAQIALHIIRIPNVYSYIKDPVLANFYDTLGIETINRTAIVVNNILDDLDELNQNTNEIE